MAIAWLGTFRLTNYALLKLLLDYLPHPLPQVMTIERLEVPPVKPFVALEEFYTRSEEKSRIVGLTCPSLPLISLRLLTQVPSNSTS